MGNKAMMTPGSCCYKRS